MDMLSLPNRIPRLAIILVILMVVVIPVMGVYDLLETFQAGKGAVYLEAARAGGERSGLGLLYAREILLLLVIGILFLWACVVGRRVPRLFGVGLFSVCLGIGCIVSLGLHPKIVLIAGIRQLMYLVLIYILYVIRHGSDRIEALFVSAAAGVAIVEFVVASVQEAFFEAAAGTTLLGSRVYGTFNNPNTLAASFAVITFIVLFLGRLSLRVRAGVVTLGIVGQLMAGSRAGVVATVLVFVTYLWRRSRCLETRAMVVIGTILLTAPLYLGLSTLSGREDVGEPLDDPRIQIFVEQIEMMRPVELLFGRGLGVGTNTLNSLARNREDVQHLVSILDSTITALVVQIGFVGLAAFLFTLVALSARCGYAGWVLFGLVFVLGINVNWLEFYPVNLMVTAAYGILWARADRVRAEAIASIGTAEATGFIPAHG